MFIKFKAVPLAVIFLFVFTGCQTSKMWTSKDILVSEKLPLRSIAFPESITSNQAAEDIDFLIYVLQSGYGGRQYAPKEYFDKAITTLRAIPTATNMYDFHQRIDEALFIIPDNHLQSHYLNQVSKIRQDYEDGAKGKVGNNNITDRKKVWEVRLDKVGKKNLLYVSIVRFPFHKSPIWDGFIEALSANLKKSDAMILDLRGNSGGDDTKGMEMAKVLFGHSFEHPISRQYRSQTPETLALFANRFAVDIINSNYDGREVSENTLRDLENSKKQYNLALSGKLPIEFIRTDKGKGSRSDPVTGYKKPIYILMDKACGSSCEFTIACFEWHGYSKKVGENTNGTFHFSNAGIAVLPNSKLKVLIPTQYSEYYDGRFIERVGFAPDIKVWPGRDAYDEVKKIIVNP